MLFTHPVLHQSEDVEGLTTKQSLQRGGWLIRQVADIDIHNAQGQLNKVQTRKPHGIHSPIYTARQHGENTKQKGPKPGPSSQAKPDPTANLQLALLLTP